MTWGRLFELLASVLNRRRNRWIEVSVTRAWSHDMQPRLFEIDGR